MQVEINLPTFVFVQVEIDGIEWDLRQNHELANGIMNRLPPRRVSKMLDITCTIIVCSRRL